LFGEEKDDLAGAAFGHADGEGSVRGVSEERFRQLTGVDGGALLMNPIKGEGRKFPLKIAGEEIGEPLAAPGGHPMDGSRGGKGEHTVVMEAYGVSDLAGVGESAGVVIGLGKVRGEKPEDIEVAFGKVGGFALEGECDADAEAAIGVKADLMLDSERFIKFLIKIEAMVLAFAEEIGDAHGIGLAGAHVVEVDWMLVGVGFERGDMAGDNGIEPGGVMGNIEMAIGMHGVIGDGFAGNEAGNEFNDAAWEDTGICD
jgi:hypothetical protein